MGRGFVKYDLPNSAASAWVLFSAFLDYRLDDGSKLHVEQQPAWCPLCGSFVTAELLQAGDDMEREIGRLQSWLGDRQPRQAGQRRMAEKSLAELKRRLRWRRSRVGPPRCLQCGSAEVVPVPGSGEFAHPATGERVISASSGFADTAPWFAEFSSEGERLAEPATPARDH
jgi:hypothetical protein